MPAVRNGYQIIFICSQLVSFTGKMFPRKSAIIPTGIASCTKCMHVPSTTIRTMVMVFSFLLSIESPPVANIQ